VVVERRGERESEGDTGEIQGIDNSTNEEKEVNKVQCRIAKKDAKKVVTVAKNNAYERLY